MKPKEIKVILLSTGGQIIEFYDFMIFVFFADIISAHYFTGSEYARYIYVFSIFALGYFVRPLGGVVFGHFGDKFGRKNAFFSAIFFISAATLLMGFVPGYKTLGIISPVIFVILRIIQGFSLGGELPGAATFVYESMPKGKKVFGTSFILAGTNLGLLLASGLVAVLYTFIDMHIITKEILWRIPFILGGVLGLVLGIMRLELMETPVFQELLKTSAVMRFPVIELFKKAPKSVFKGILIYFFLIYATIVMVTMPNLLSSYLHYYSPEQTSAINSAAIFVLILLIPISGYIADKFNFNVNIYFAVSCFLLAASASVVFHFAQMQNVWILFAGYFIFAVIYSTAQSTELPILASLFPPIVRYSGLGAVMNIGAIGLGLIPLLAVFLIKHTEGLYALVLLSIVACMVSAFAALWFYFRPPNRKKIWQLQNEIRELYSNLNKLPLEAEAKKYIKSDIKQASDVIKIEDIDTPAAKLVQSDADFSKAGDFIKEYTKKVLNAKTEREKMVLSRLMHYEYDAVVYGKPVSESLRKHIGEVVDQSLNKIINNQNGN